MIWKQEACWKQSAPKTKSIMTGGWENSRWWKMIGGYAWQDFSLLRPFPHNIKSWHKGKRLKHSHQSRRNVSHVQVLKFAKSHLKERWFILDGKNSRLQYYKFKKPRHNTGAKMKHQGPGHLNAINLFLNLYMYACISTHNNKVQQQSNTHSNEHHQ